MKNNSLTILMASLLLLFAVSCNSGSGNNETQNSDSLSVTTEQKSAMDYSGVYTTSAESLCKITLTITKAAEEYSYQISMDKLNYTGKIIFEVTEGQTYLAFDGQIGDNAPKTVSGQLMDGAIMIQNYGNSMNEYHYFKQCDEKFLEFKK